MSDFLTAIGYTAILLMCCTFIYGLASIIFYPITSRLDKLIELLKNKEGRSNDSLN